MSICFFSLIDSSTELMMDPQSKRQDGHSVLMNKARSNSISKVILTKSDSIDSTPPTPTPKTPTDMPNINAHGSVTSSPSGSMSPDHGAQNLPPELVQAGWRKFWSTRENRPYFFNKMTNASLWETPVLGVDTAVHVSLYDILHITFTIYINIL